MSKLASFRYLKLFNKNLTQGRVLDMIRIAIKTPAFSTQTRMSRMNNPAGDSYVLCQFFVYMTTKYNFSQFVNRIGNTVIYKLLTNAGANQSIKGRGQILGLEIALHGRIPREPVRARKTVQSLTLGRRSQANKGSFIINRAEGLNPELGTFSF